MQFCVAIVTQSSRKYKSTVGGVIKFDDDEAGEPALSDCSILIDDGRNSS